MNTAAGVLAGVRDAVVAGSAGRLRRLVVYGSRATGRARPESDVDLVAFVEPPDTSWGVPERQAEQERLRRAAAPAVAAAFGPTAQVDLVVRTLDQDAEAREVVGGVEHWAATTGLVLYERAPDRPVAPQRQRADVVGDHTRAWLQFAARTLAHAETRAERGTAGDAVTAAAIQFDVVLAVRRACLAVHAHYQIWDASSYDKHTPLSAVVALIKSAAPTLAAEMRATLAAAPPSIRIGRRVLDLIITHLLRRGVDFAVPRQSLSQACHPNASSDLRHGFSQGVAAAVEHALRVPVPGPVGERGQCGVDYLDEHLARPGTHATICTLPIKRPA